MDSHNIWIGFWGAFQTRFDDALNRTIRVAKTVPVFIKYNVGRERFEKAPDADDLALLKKIDASPIPYWYPTDPIPKGDKTGDLFGIGITHAHHLHTKRNLWALGAFVARAQESTFRFELLYCVTAALPELIRRARLRVGAYFHGGRGSISAGQTGNLYIPSISAEKRVFSESGTA